MSLKVCVCVSVVSARVRVCDYMGIMNVSVFEHECECVD